MPSGSVGPKLVVSDEQLPDANSPKLSISKEIPDAKGGVELDTHALYVKTWADLADKGFAVGGTLIALRALAYVATLGSSEMLVVGLIDSKVTAAKAMERGGPNQPDINALLEHKIRYELGENAVEDYRQLVAPYLSDESAAKLLNGIERFRNREGVTEVKNLIAEMRPKELWDSDARRLFLLMRENGLEQEMTGLESARGLLTKDQFQGLSERLGQVTSPTELAQFQADFANTLHEVGYRGVKQASV